MRRLGGSPRRAKTGGVPGGNRGASYARKRVSDAKRLAVKELRHANGHDPGPLLAAIAGVPRPDQARRLVAELDRALWAA